MFSQENAATTSDDTPERPEPHREPRSPLTNDNSNMIYLHSQPPDRVSGNRQSIETESELPPGFALRQALAFSQEQLEAIAKIRIALQQMALLAQAALQVPEAERPVRAKEFQTWVARIQHHRAEEFAQAKLFDGQTVVVNVEPQGNRLVMAGVNLRAIAYTQVLDSGVEHPTRGARARATTEAALRQLAFDETIVRANVERLHFCLQQTLILNAAPTGAGAQLAAPMGHLARHESGWSPGEAYSPRSRPALQTALG